MLQVRLHHIVQNCVPYHIIKHITMMFQSILASLFYQLVSLCKFNMHMYIYIYTVDIHMYMWLIYITLYGYCMVILLYNGIFSTLYHIKSIPQSYGITRLLNLQHCGSMSVIQRCSPYRAIVEPENVEKPPWREGTSNALTKNSKSMFGRNKTHATGILP